MEVYPDFKYDHGGPSECVEVNFILTNPIFLKKSHLKLVQIGFNLFLVLHRKLRSDFITGWRLITENWALSTLIHTALP